MKNGRPKNVTEEYEAVVREIQDSMGKAKAWGTRILRGDEGCIYTMYNFTRLDQDWQKRACPRATRKEWRHKILMYAPPETLKELLKRWTRPDWGDDEWTRMAGSHYYKMVMTDFERELVRAYRHDEVDTEILTEYQVGRCAVAKLSCQE
jgi:hypothetical protein